MEGEVEELTRTAVALAKGGNVVMLKLLLGPLLPKGRPVQVDLPPTDGDFDPVEAMGAILKAAVTGEILPSDAAALSGVVADYARALDVTELRVRLETLEKRLPGEHHDGSKFARPAFEIEKRLSIEEKKRKEKDEKFIRDWAIQPPETMRLQLRQSCWQVNQNSMNR